MKIGEKLKEIRHKKDLSLRDVEKSTGLSRGYISNVENGKVKSISVDKLKAFSDFYNIPIQELLERDDQWREKLPDKLKKFVDENNIEYLELGLRAKEKGLSPESVDKLIDLLTEQVKS